MPIRHSFRRHHLALFLAGLSAVSIGAYSQLSSAAPKAPNKAPNKRVKPASRGGNPLARVAPRVNTRAKKQTPLVRPVTTQSFSAQVLAPGARDFPPPVEREFRAAWVATVFNMDWPSQPGLSPAQQQVQVLTILDRAKELNLNALIWQVRPMCDALYASDIEPWSRFLTGTAGKNPGYDPLAFIVAESRKRGLEVHAWFNPYRAGSSADTSLPPRHISKTNPSMVVRYGKFLWLDPSQSQVRRYTTRVVLDVVKRYDIDGVHLDDYFYPYVEKDSAGRAIPFPDDARYARYLDNGGQLSKGDWRREGVNTLIRELNSGIKKQKSWVKFGISPFGIWRPGNPSSVRGLDAYGVLYADSRLWLQQGWVDYFTPQLYWALDAPQQGYRELLNWWVEQNTKNRHIWPGHNAQKIGNGFDAREVVAQIHATRNQQGASGDVLFSARVLTTNKGNINSSLQQSYADPALVPASPWMDAKGPVAPKVSGKVDGFARTLNLNLQPGDGERIASWTIQMRLPRADGTSAWATQIVPGDRRSFSITVSPEQMPDRVAVSAVDRVGNQSALVGASLQ